MKTPRIFLTLSPILLSACLRQDDYVSSQDAASAESDSPPSNPADDINYPTISGPNCGPATCRVAVNGAMHVDISPWDAQNPKISFAKGLFAVNWQLNRSADVTATSPGIDQLLISSTNLEPVAIAIKAEEVTDVDIVPAGKYRTKSESYAYLANSSTLQLLLKPEPPNPDSNYLVDQSIALPEGSTFAHAKLTYPDPWDIFVVADAAGDIPFTVSGDSFGTRTLSVPVVSQIDRIEATLLKTDLVARDNQTVCFNAYAGDLEVIGDVAWSATGDMEDKFNPSANCLAFRVGRFGGDYTIAATIGGQRNEVSFSAPRSLHCNDNICEIQEYEFCDSCPAKCGDGVCLQSEIGECHLDCF